MLADINYKVGLLAMIMSLIVNFAYAANEDSEYCCCHAGAESGLPYVYCLKNTSAKTCAAMESRRRDGSYKWIPKSRCTKN